MKRRTVHRILYAELIEDEGDSVRVAFTCKTCGHVTRRWYGRRARAKRNQRGSMALIRKWSKPGGYWHKGTGFCRGSCPACEKEAV